MGGVDVFAGDWAECGFVVMEGGGENSCTL